jgi:hypothetical protein
VVSFSRVETSKQNWDIALRHQCGGNIREGKFGAHFIESHKAEFRTVCHVT